MVGSPHLSWDEFAVWVKFLPHESQTFQSIRGPQWSAEMHRLTDVLEVLSWANWQRGGGRGPKPKPVKRPGQVQKFGSGMEFDEAKNRLAAWSRGLGVLPG